MGTIPMGGRGAGDIGIAMALAAPAVGAAEAAHAVGAEAARHRPALLHLGARRTVVQRARLWHRSDMLQRHGDPWCRGHRGGGG